MLLRSDLLLIFLRPDPFNDDDFSVGSSLLFFWFLGASGVAKKCVTKFGRGREASEFLGMMT